MARPVILMYHGFGVRTPGADPHNLFVVPELLERQLRIVRRAYRPLDLDGYVRGLRTGRWPRRSALVTIDDGYVSTLEIAAPLLRDLGIPAVLFVPPALVGGRTSWMPEMPDEGLLDAEGLRAVADHGIEIGAHGMDHTVMTGLDAEELRRHTVGAADALEEIMGTRPRAFAYPVGLFDDRAVAAVRDAGYEVGFSVHDDGGPFAIPRTPVTGRDSTAVFMARLLPGFDRLWRGSGPMVRRAAARVLRQRPSG